MVRRPLQQGCFVVADLCDNVALENACSEVSAVFHCAGYAHAFSSLANSDAEKHWRINFEGTRNLVEAAGRAGVKRFVFLSSVKAMAEPGESCADEDFPGEPETAYGQSKRAAERAVIEAGTRYGMHVVNLRLAMVYGAGGHGNLERMGRLVRKGIFPPLPETGNRRSLVHVDDVVAAILAVEADTRTAGKTYIICGPEAPSGRQLFTGMCEAVGVKHYAWSFPASFFRQLGEVGECFGKLLGRRLPINKEIVQRLLDSACYDGSRIQADIGWRPVVHLKDGLQEMLRR